jgi:hypothetical protein
VSHTLSSLPLPPQPRPGVNVDVPDPDPSCGPTRGNGRSGGLTASRAGQDQSGLTAPALIVAEDRYRICLPPISPLYLGRYDEPNHICPHIDFTAHGGVINGVSRQHACIHHTAKGLAIEDLGSLNGTFVNGRQIAPYELFPLEHGDMLQLGELRLAVTFL